MEVRTALGDLDGPVRARLEGLARDDVVRRIWGRDHTVWRDDPTEIADRLGWLDAVDRSRDALPEIRAFVNEVRAAGLTRTVLLGMGGSSLAPEVIRRTFYRDGTPTFDLTVLDSTHPDAIARLEGTLDLARTLFVVSSKSGTTIETRSHMAYFLDRVGDGSRFAAITDPGSPLEEAARGAGFRRVFQAQADVGGRYSALTAFGLIPAALCGVDPEILLVEAAHALRSCLPDVPVDRNPAALLGAAIGEGCLRGRDKLTFLLPEDASPFGGWAEQLLAESTGKDGTGILPVDGEPVGPPDVYGPDRLFAVLGHSDLHPRVTVPFHRPPDLGAMFLVWELAVAVAGHVLGIQPFDQPDVQEAKDRTARFLEEGTAEEPVVLVDDLLERVRPGDYVAIQAFCDPTDDLAARLQGVRVRIRDRFRVATTLGFGPRFLHSTGQIHKGGPASGVFLQVLDPPREDRPVPGRAFAFGELIAAQAAGDLDALRTRGRRAGRVALDDLLAWGR